jgi:hypothetical protein
LQLFTNLIYPLLTKIIHLEPRLITYLYIVAINIIEIFLMIRFILAVKIHPSPEESY